MTAFEFNYLSLSQSNNGQFSGVGYIGNFVVYWGIRVWLLHYNNTVIELTEGEPVAVVSRDMNGEGLQNATWTPTTTILNNSDSVLTQPFIDGGFGFGWEPLYDDLHGGREFKPYTEQLQVSVLLNSTWNVFYYTKRDYYGVYTTTLFFWGNSVYNSRIENMQFDDGVEGLSFSSGVVIVGVVAALVCIVAAAGLGLSGKKRR